MKKQGLWKPVNLASSRKKLVFKRSYKDGEEWKDSDTYWSDHLPLLAKAADLAHTAILTELRKSGSDS